MARTVIKAVTDYQHADADYSQANNYLKGYIVQSFEDGTDVGSKIGLPRFVIIDTPGVPLSAIRPYEIGYHREISYTIVASDPVVDGFRVDVSVSNDTVTKKGQIKRAQIESFLNLWGASIVSVTANRVRFDVKVYDAAVSQQIWGGAPVVFSEDSYDQATGTHRIRATYNNAPVGPRIEDQAINRVESVGGGVVTSDPGAIVFDITREVVFDLFKQDIKSKLDGRFLTRRYYLDPVVVDQAIANGGTLTMTGPEALAAIKDFAAE